jgi:DNA-binding MarR family transcriptional regulator
MKEKNDNKIYFDIFDSLRKIIKTVDIYSQRLKEIHDITSSQLSCLIALKGKDSVSLSDLSKKLSLSPSMITIIIDQLEKKKLLLRERSSTDRRVIYIKLTDEGKKMVKKSPLTFQRKLIDGLSSLSRKEKEEIDVSLKKILSIIISEVLIDSPILSSNDKLVGIDRNIIEYEPEIKANELK